MMVKPSLARFEVALLGLGGGNWTSYALVFCSAHREGDAISARWEARQRFAWDPFIRTELGRILRENGDLTASGGVLREAVGHFPNNIVCRNALADLLIVLDEADESERIFREALELDARNPVARGGLARVLYLTRYTLTLTRSVSEDATHVLAYASG